MSVYQDSGAYECVPGLWYVCVLYVIRITCRCVEVGVPANVSVTASSILLEETQVPLNIARNIENSHSRPVQRVFIDWQVLPAQNITVTAASSGSPINITLTGLEGVTPFLVYGLRNVNDNTPTNGAIKRYAKLGTASSSAKVSLLTPSGAPIFNQPIDPYLQQLISSESSFGSILDGPWSGLYFIDYTKDRIASFNGIIGAGWRKSENNEILQITPGVYTPEVPRVITIVTVDATGAVVSGHRGAHTSYTIAMGSVLHMYLILSHITQARQICKHI